MTGFPGYIYEEEESRIRGSGSSYGKITKDKELRWLGETINEKRCQICTVDVYNNVLLYLKVYCTQVKETRLEVKK